MSIATKLDRLNTIKQDIKSALEEKGQTPSNNFTTYADEIRNIQVGGGSDSLGELISGSIVSASSDTTSVRSYGFYQCKSLKTINLPNVTTLGASAFSGCSALKNASLPLVTELGGNNVFSGCSSLESVSLPAFTYTATTKNYLFQNCNALKNVDIPNVTRFRGTNIFNNCISLETINLPSLTNSDGNMFYGCTNLKYVSLPKLTMVYDYDFYNCNSLSNIKLEVATRVASYGFQYCSLLDSAYIPKLEQIDSSAFLSCSSLKVLITKYNNVATLKNTNAFNGCYHILGTTHSTYNPTGAKDGYIYVPDNLVDSYKSATNWSTFASQIKGISELPTEYKELYGI